MQHITLGTLEVGRIGLGAMGMSAAYTGAGSDDAESIRTIHRALDLGVTLIDTAEVYGPHTNEELVGRALKGRRDQVVLATKFGFMSNTGRSWRLDSSPENIRIAVEGSLRRLDTDHIDLYYQHRVDPNDPDRGDRRRPGRARRRGQGPPHRPVRGRGRHHPPRARRASRSPRCSRSTRCGPATPRRTCCRCCGSSASGSSPYSPLGHGFLTGTIRSHRRPRRRRLAQDQPPLHRDELPAQPARIADEVEAVAAEAGATPAQVALAWLLAQGDDIVAHPRHQAGRPARGERRRRHDRAHRRADRQARQPHPRRRRPPQRGASRPARTVGPGVSAGPFAAASRLRDWSASSRFRAAAAAAVRDQGRATARCHLARLRTP